jgi:hypothetical protein
MYVNTLSIVEKTKAFTQLKKLWEVECQCLTLNTDRNMEVIFITGKAGSGKTTYAKRMLDKLGLDYCISSSSNDPFQDYLGQKAIILDDLRDKSFELEDLLKILDNNTKSSVKSRFNNKVFNGEMIIITSSVPINYWYKEYQYNGSEDLNQLYRRINQYIIVNQSIISIYEDGLDDLGFPKGKGYPIMNDLISNIKKENKQKTDLKSIFKQLNE